MFQSDTRRGGGPSRFGCTLLPARSAAFVWAASRVGGVVATVTVPADGRGTGTSVPGGVTAMSFAPAQPPSMASADRVGPAPFTAEGGVAIHDSGGEERRCDRALVYGRLRSSRGRRRSGCLHLSFPRQQALLRPAASTRVPFARCAQRLAYGRWCVRAPVVRLHAPSALRIAPRYSTRTAKPWLNTYLRTRPRTSGLTVLLTSALQDSLDPHLGDLEISISCRAVNPYVTSVPHLDTSQPGR